MPTDPTFVTHVFRVRFWRMLLVGLVFAQFIYTAFVWIMNAVTAIQLNSPLFSEMNLTAYVGGSVCITVLIVPSFLVLVYLLPVKVNRDTFACANAFGSMVTVPWEDITAVRSCPIPGFPYLLLSLRGRVLKLWLTLALHRFPEFVERVEQFAGTDHPLFQALWVRAERRN